MEYDEWQKQAYKRQKANERMYGVQIAADIWIKEHDKAVDEGILPNSKRIDKKDKQ